MKKLAYQLNAGDVIVLGPCDPTYTVETVLVVYGRVGPGHAILSPSGLEIRARPSVATGEEGPDGCESFICGLNDEWEVGA